MTPATSSAALCREGSENGQWLLPAFLSGKKLSLSSCPDARQLSSPVYATDAIQAAIPMLVQELRAMCLSKSVCGFFKWNCFGVQQILPLTQIPMVFAVRSYGDLSSWHWNPELVRGAWCGAGTPHS